MFINLKNKADIKSKMFKHYVSLRKLKDTVVTAYVDTDYDLDNENFWSIVMRLDEDRETVWAKIAYRSRKSIMAEYNMDFIMPYNEETKEVDNTEIAICGDLYDIDNMFDQILKEYERIEETYMNRGYVGLAA